MRERVFGIETEYAVIYHPSRAERASGALRPTNLAIYGLFEPLLAAFCRGLPRAFSLLRSKQGQFLENGTSFHYEATPRDFEHGLVEMASPECRDPFQLVACERAKDGLLEEVCEQVNARLRLRGVGGDVRIGKNNVDSAGHTFGSHESYWVEDPLSIGRRLALAPLWLGLWILTLPVVAWLVAVTLTVIVGGLAVSALPLVALPLKAVAVRLHGRLARAGQLMSRAANTLRQLPERMIARLRDDPGALVRNLAWVELPFRPLLALHSRLYDRFFFVPVRRNLCGFLVSRIAWAGAGQVVLDGGPLFRLAQRPPHLRRIARIFTSGDARPIFETRDPFFRPWSAFASRRRLHLMVGDANLCDWALALRVGATALVLEAIESDGSASWPELVDPLAAQNTLNRDCDFHARVALVGGETLNALELQRRYLAGVRRVLCPDGARPATEWKARVLDMWEQTLTLLETEPDALADRLDWVAKRRLLARELGGAIAASDIERAGAEALRKDALPALRDAAFRALRTDLRYHELGPGGGHRRLESRGRIRRLVDDAEVARARREPPADTRAFARGHAIREACLRGQGGAASWHRVRLGLREWRWFADPLRNDVTFEIGAKKQA